MDLALLLLLCRNMGATRFISGSGVLIATNASLTLAALTSEILGNTCVSGHFSFLALLGSSRSITFDGTDDETTRSVLLADIAFSIVWALLNCSSVTLTPDELGAFDEGISCFSSLALTSAVNKKQRLVGGVIFSAGMSMFWC